MIVVIIRKKIVEVIRRIIVEKTRMMIVVMIRMMTNTKDDESNYSYDVSTNKNKRII